MKECLSNLYLDRNSKSSDPIDIAIILKRISFWHYND